MVKINIHHVVQYSCIPTSIMLLHVSQLDGSHFIRCNEWDLGMLCRRSIEIHVYLINTSLASMVNSISTFRHVAITQLVSNRLFVWWLRYNLILYFSASYKYRFSHCALQVHDAPFNWPFCESDLTLNGVFPYVVPSICIQGAEWKISGMYIAIHRLHVYRLWRKSSNSVHAWILRCPNECHSFIDKDWVDIKASWGIR